MADGQLPCDDYAEFKRSLQELRIIDDKIIYEMNKTVPTSSFKETSDAADSCRMLKAKLEAAFSQRKAGINACVEAKTAQVLQMKAALGVTDEDQRHKQGKGKTGSDQRELRTTQQSLRQMRAEGSAEEILQDQTWTIFNTRCGRMLR